MNEWEFFNEFKQLCEYFKDETYKNKRITKMYYEKVKHMNIKDFKILCDRLISEYKYMPKIADFGGNYVSYICDLAHKARTYTEEELESFYEM